MGAGLIVGVDPSSSKMAVAVGTNERDAKIYAYKFPAGPDNRPDTMRRIHILFDSIGFGSPILRAGFELPTATKAGPGSLIPQAMAQGAAIAGLGNNAQAVDQIDVGSWKKQIVGKGNATKDEIADWVREHHPYAYVQCAPDKLKFDQDMCDAFCIYLYTLRRELAFQKIQRIRERRKK